MKIVRIYTGADNQSHFEDLQIPLKDSGKIGFMSELMKATGVVFRETGGDYNFDFHTAPRRQYVVNLEGEVEIEVGDGTKRILRAGDVLLAEDTTGKDTSAALSPANPGNRCLSLRLKLLFIRGKESHEKIEVFFYGLL